MTNHVDNCDLCTDFCNTPPVNIVLLLWEAHDLLRYCGVPQHYTEESDVFVVKMFIDM